MLQLVETILTWRIKMSNGKFAHIVSNNGTITLLINNKNFVVARQHLNYDKIKAALLAKDYKKLPALVDLDSGLNRYVKGKVEVKNGHVLFNGVAIHHNVVDRILKMREEGFEFDSMARFLENLMMNPNSRCREVAYQFIEYQNMPITPEGLFLGYKCVKSDYYDKHSGTIKNEIGAVIKMDRSKVSDNPDHDCSYGLHVGSLEYSGPGRGFYSNGDILLVVEVNPKDIVSVPTSASCQKMRVCEYKVVGKYEGDLANQMVNSVASSDKSVEKTYDANVDLAYDTGYDAGYSEDEFENPYDSETDEKLYDAYNNGYDDGCEQREEDDAEEEVDEQDSREDDAYEIGHLDGSNSNPSAVNTYRTVGERESYDEGYADGCREVQKSYGYAYVFDGKKPKKAELGKRGPSTYKPKRDASGRFSK